MVAIEAHAQPCMHLPCRSYGPDQAVDGVLELAGGQAEDQDPGGHAGAGLSTWGPGCTLSGTLNCGREPSG